MNDAPTVPFAVTRNRRDFIKRHKAGAARSDITVCTLSADYVALAAREATAITNRTLVGERIRVAREDSRRSVVPNSVGVVARG